jgi:hypothetical protein
MAQSGGGETRAHRLLKKAALVWALEQGYRAGGYEVRLPNSNFRADVAACRLERPASYECEIGLTAAFECKQARPDFLNDARPEAESLSRLAKLNRRRKKLEQLVGAHYPNLRQGDTLFPEFDRTDVSEIRHEGYRKVVAEIRTLESAIFGRTKFDRLVRYRCVDLCYLVIRPGILQADESPSVWGLLTPADENFDLDAEDAEAPPLQLLRKPQRIDAPETHRLELLHQLAVSGTWRLLREGGIESDLWERSHPGKSADADSTKEG